MEGEGRGREGERGGTERGEEEGRRERGGESEGVRGKEEGRRERRSGQEKRLTFCRVL